MVSFFRVTVSSFVNLDVLEFQTTHYDPYVHLKHIDFNLFNKNCLCVAIFYDMIFWNKASL